MQDVRSDDLDRGNVDQRAKGAERVERPGGLHRQEPGLVDRHSGVGDDVTVSAEVGERLAERNAEHRSLAEALERALGRTDRTHAMVDAARTQTALRDLKAAAWPSDDAAHWEAHVVEEHLGMTMGLVQVPEHRQHTQGLHTWRIGRDEHHRMPFVSPRVRISDAHENVEAATRVAGAAGPPLLTVQHDLVANHLAGSLHVGRVARRDGRFGHRKAGTDLPCEQRLEPLLLLLLGPVLDQDLGIAGIGRAAIEHLRRQKAATRDLRDGRVITVV